MGTSTDYKSPSGTNWRGHKSRVTNAAAAGSNNSAKLGNVVGSFLRATGAPASGGSSSSGGGGRRGTGRRGGVGGRAGRTAATRLSGFAIAVGAQGLGSALQDLGLGNLIGSTAEDIRDALVNVLCEDGGLLDEGDARAAMDDSIETLLGTAQTYAEVEAALTASLSSPQLREVLYRFFGNYIYWQLLRNHYERLLRAQGAQSTQDFFREVKATIQSSIGDFIADNPRPILSWAAPDIQTFIGQVQQDIFDIFQ